MRPGVEPAFGIGDADAAEQRQRLGPSRARGQVPMRADRLHDLRADAVRGVETAHRS